MSDQNGLFRTRVYPYAVDAPVDHARIRSCAEDFIVDEVLGFTPDGDGEHLLLRVRKRERNSYDVIQWLSQRMGAPRRDIGFCGMKDRVAVTSQWFSLPAKANQRVPVGISDGIEVVETALHGRKLRRGQHRANRFEIRLRDPSDAGGDIEQRFERICRDGVPNYFGPQRFGRDGENVDNAMAMLNGRYRARNPQIKGILLSSLRSFLFNEILAERVDAGNWNLPLSGDVFQRDDNGERFQSNADQEQLRRQCQTHEIHPTAVLTGPGEDNVVGEARALETQVLGRHGDITAALLDRGPSVDRRSLRLKPTAATFRRDDEGIVVGFELGRGSFATSLLRELVNDSDSQPPWQEN